MKKRDYFFLLLFAVLFFLGFVIAQDNKLYIVDEEIRTNDCAFVPGWEEVSRFESGNGITIKHCVRKETYSADLNFVIYSYLNVQTPGENSCASGFEDHGSFADDDNNAVVLCVKRGNDLSVEELKKEIKISGSCGEGLVQEGERAAVNGNEIAHCGEESAVDKDSGISSSDVKKDDVDSKKAKTSNGGSGILESNAKPKTISCAGLNIQECPTKEGCSPKIGGILSSFFRICEGSYVVEVEDEIREVCREDCSGINNLAICATTQFCHVKNGVCVDSGCAGVYTPDYPSLKIPVCNKKKEVYIDIKEGEPEEVNILSVEDTGFCTKYKVEFQNVNCNDEEDVALPPNQPEEVFTSPPQATIVVGPCGLPYLVYGSLGSDEGCEKEFEDQASPPGVCQAGDGGGSGEGEGLDAQCIKIINEIRNIPEFGKDLYESKKLIWRILGQQFVLVRHAKALVEFVSTPYMDKDGEKHVKLDISPIDSVIISLEKAIKVSGESYAEKLWPEDNEIERGKIICVDRTPYKKTNIFGAVSYKRNQFIAEMKEYFVNSFKSNGGKAIVLMTKEKVTVVDGNGKGNDVSFNIVCGEKIFESKASDMTDNGKFLVYVEFDGKSYGTKERNLNLFDSIILDSPSGQDSREASLLKIKYDGAIEKIKKTIDDAKKCLEDAKKYCDENGNSSNLIDCSKVVP